MREAYVLGFRFRFLDENKKRQHYFYKMGSVTRDGVVLEGQVIFFADIFKVKHHRNILVLSLMPFATTTRGVSDRIVSRYNCLVLEMDSMVMVSKVESAINLRCTTQVVEKRWKDIPKAIRLKEFKKVYCPRCDALHDLSDMIYSPVTYCKYCDALFDNYGYMLPGSHEYKVCPYCEYYDRVQDYQEYHVYYVVKEKRFYKRRRYCCDTCMERHFKVNFWKNLTFGIGAFVSLWEKIRSTRGRNPFYGDLTRANYLSQMHRFEESDVLYSSLVFKNDGHPGIHMNYGLMYLEKGDRGRAAFQFKKALDACSNYLPVIEIMRRHVDLAPEQLREQEEEGE